MTRQRKLSQEEKDNSRERMMGNMIQMTHGGRYWLKTNKMPPGNEDIELYLGDLKSQFISDLGGEITSGQAVVIDMIIVQLGYTLLIERWIANNTAILPVKQDNKTVDIRMAGPLNQFYLACQNAIKRNIELLDLHKGRIPRDISEFERYVQSQGKEDESDESED